MTAECLELSKQRHAASALGFTRSASCGQTLGTHVVGVVEGLCVLLDAGSGSIVLVFQGLGCPEGRCVASSCGRCGNDFLTNSLLSL